MQFQALPMIMVLAVVLAGIGGSDYWLRERPRLPESAVSETPPPATSGAESSIPSATGTSSSRHAVRKGQSTKKRQAVNVQDVLAAFGLQEQQTRELSLLQLTSPTGESVTASVLLKDNDRAALLAWLDSPNAKTIFIALKESLRGTFSAEVREVVDQTLTPEDGAVIDILSFIDPAISSEKVIFARTRTRLYEFHVATGQDDLVARMISELAK